jgi:tRNA threonylcarbamoyladenosine biosynthesis protein TsaB
MLLALDTSSLTLSLALVRPRTGELLAEERHGPPDRQSDLLPRVLMQLLERHALSLSEVTGFAVGLGPGSFTGLRIGLSTLKGLAYARRIPMGGASSLAALALDGPEGHPLATVSVARRGEVYVGRYRRTAEQVEVLGPEAAWSEEQLLAWLVAEPEARLLGPALHEGPRPGLREKLLDADVDPRRLLAEPAIPSAWAVARLATVPALFDAQALFALEPHYVRASEAERNPKFPPLPGAAPGARLRGEEEQS